ncbi:MAG TPA: hypothetical protein VK886_08620 [Vicinamibacterales bacterium]|nr:hypothetical protein [Vicinamibacterales bacterium]
MIIADRSDVNAAPAVRIARAISVAAAIVGLAAALYYARLGLTLSHYDAKGHLVVARRVIDSLTPGWQQIGAVWLPLPHLLNLLPVQIDALYRSGASAIAVSILSAAGAAYALAAAIERTRGAAVPAAAAAAIVALNPNTLYLQSTPMTEPLLLGTMLLSVLFVREWADGAPTGRRAGPMLFLACWTRYEAWPVTGALLALGAAARVRRGEPVARVLRATARLAAWPAAAGALFLLLSRITVGAWFVASGFFVAENPALNDPVRAAAQVFGGAVTVAGLPLVLAGCAGALAIAAAAVTRRERASTLVLLAPLAASALPFYAFVQGHPYRVRYMVVHIASLALASCGALALLPRMLAAIAAAALVSLTLYARPPLDDRAAMVREAQWDRPNAAARRAVTAYLRERWDGEPIMASMGSLGHYMQELSHAGIDIAGFLHEGNGDLWKAALEDPAPHVQWILVEEKAEGGDMLAARARRDPAFLSHYVRAASGGGVALYVRTARRS